MTTHSKELEQGKRFAFGENWSRFLTLLDERRIELAMASLQQMLDLRTLQGMSFLDVGSGSGLFSLAARRLGASVASFDYDPQSVSCTEELRRRYFPGDAHWRIQTGSALDATFMSQLGAFDIVYAWGVLHHTGDMYRALDQACRRVNRGGRIFLSVYNDQGRWSERWRWIKRTYNRLPSWARLCYTFVIMGPRELRALLYRLLKGQVGEYLKYRRDYATVSLRGMSYWHDIVDWVGGYPFEVAKPEAVFDFLKARGFRLDRLKTCGGDLGCNEYVFTQPGDYPGTLDS